MKKLAVLMVLVVPSFSYCMDFSGLAAQQAEALANLGTKVQQIVANNPSPAAPWTPWSIAFAGLQYGAVAYATYKTAEKIKEVRMETDTKIDIMNRQYEMAKADHDSRMRLYEQQPTPQESKVREALNFLDELDINVLRMLAQQEEDKNSASTVFRERYRNALEEANIRMPALTHPPRE